MKTLVMTSVLAISMAGMAMGGDKPAAPPPAKGHAMEAKKDIVDTAVAAGNFTTLAKALTEAGLIDTLKGPGPFTVFAPTDAAFAKIPKKELDALLKDKAKLTRVLTYHVVPGKLLAADVLKLNDGSQVKTVEGSAFTLHNRYGKVKVGDAAVITTDVLCSNGVIHAIDTVIMPPDQPTMPTN